MTLYDASFWRNFFDEDKNRRRRAELCWCEKKTFDYDGDEPVICAIRLRRKRLWNLELWSFSPELY